MAHSSRNHHLQILANPACQVVFAGFESNTRRLGQMGWQMSLEEDLSLMVRRLMLRNRQAGIVCFAECSEFDTIRWRQAGQPLNRLPTFIVQRMMNEPDIQVQVCSGELLPEFKEWADMRPMVIETDSIFKHPLFLAKEAPVVEELIVDPNEVQSLLDRIKQIQAPEQEQIRKRRARETPLAKATILTFGT